MWSEEKGQVSFEYLLTALFGVMLALAAALLLDAVRNVALSAKARILEYSYDTVSSLMS